ncbi:hypothetical protein HY501_02415 [Candidatus Woesearchaeota archaeon]|nr:hypothetical protein [Candidatus Woesearchaeota archaeon]
MNFRQSIAGTVAALALYGCGASMNYHTQPNGMVVPNYDSKAKKGIKMLGLGAMEELQIDKNGDGKTDMMEVTLYDAVADFKEKPASKHLLVDANRDGLADVIFSDMYKKDPAVSGPDGEYDLSSTVGTLYQSAFGVPPKKDELKLGVFSEMVLPSLVSRLKLMAAPREKLEAFVMQSNGIYIPRFTLEGAEKAERKYWEAGFGIAIAFVDTNKDKVPDLVHMAAHLLTPDGRLGKEPLGAYLIVDLDHNGSADLIYSDSVTKDWKPGADGTFDDVSGATIAFLNMGIPVRPEDLKMENVIRFFAPDTEEGDE